jgi:hypothetical protein
MLFGYSFLRTLIPFTEDQKVFFAASMQAQISGDSFPSNVYQQWEMKPWPSRMLFYFIFRLFGFAFQNKYIFIILVQITVILAIWLAVVLLATFLQEKRKKLFIGFAVISLTSVGPDSYLQIEFMALVLSLFAIYLLGNVRKDYRFFGEALLVLITSLKGSTVFFSVLTVVIVAELRNEVFRNHLKKYIRIATLNIFAVFVISNELLDRAALQGAEERSLRGIFGESELIDLFFGLKGAITDFPAMIFFPPIFLGLLSRKHQLKFRIFQTVIVIVFFYSLSFQHYFNYHFLFILYLVIVSFLLWNTLDRPLMAHEKVMGGLSALTMALVLIDYWTPVDFRAVHSDVAIVSVSKIEHSFRVFEEEKQTSRTLSEILQKEKVLFITDGVINFYLSNRSACEEFYPVHFQRGGSASANSRILNSFWYTDFIRCATQYDGKYVLAQTSWIPRSSAEQLIGKWYKSSKVLTAGNRVYVLYSN